ncbi:hypothetical protein F5Y00DRAFT_250506 [Daldinia vernicosa]|uniref:uncharacterized protein n=1 Tax=Daldinia vernicosa TaxID=114800 RepID=UPI002008DED7|nr:uncharacterized protein F5Y00DRAFT_250506 [Daldinia vernicosa]KAI0853830.1 hypothetical protein F5Y00DRAFT_250506 [Daldinia vernicosa]
MKDLPDYPIPQGVHAIPPELLDTRSDDELDNDIMHPRPVSSEKNIWFFWHAGYATMHPYAKRNVRAWHRRLSKRGWTVRVLDRAPGSLSNVANFLDVSDPHAFPRAFAEGTIGGRYAMQHASDLVRWPLLLRYGGVYADVGLMQIGDLDRLWNETVANPDSPFEVLSYNLNGGLANYFLASRPGNPFFERCHRLFLALWAEDGGKTSTDGMHASPLLKGVPLMSSSVTIEEDGKIIGSDEVQKMLSDYIAQGQATSMVMGLVDDEDGWDGPRYVADHIYGIDYMVGSQLINEITGWDGKKAFNLMSLPLPKPGEVESADQKQAREIVEACLQRSFGFKLAHGLIIRVFKYTLGSLWRDHEGSDDVPGTYAHWLRHGTAYWNQDELPPALEFGVIEPFKRGPLLREK